MGQKVFGIAVVVFLIGIAVYFVRQNPLQKLNTDQFNPFHFFSSSSSTTSTLLGQKSHESQPRPQPQPSPSPLPPTINPRDIPTGFTLDQLSTAFHKVRFSGVSPGSGFGLRSEVSLYAYLKEGEKINVTGWKLEAKRGSQIIPRAIDIYEPSGLTPEEDIYLSNGESLRMFSNISTIRKNLRLNKCLGYLENTNHFDPPLPRNCPTDFRSETRDFSGQCQDYVNSIGSCQLPNTNPPSVPQNDYGCRPFLETLNYRGCFDRYRADKDFLGREWRVWLGSKFLDERHDRVFLLDRQGLLVDVREY